MNSKQFSQIRSQQHKDFVNRKNKKTITVTSIEKAFLDRMKEKGDYVVVGVGNLWWANENHKGCLIEGLSCDEKEALFSLETKQLVKHNTTSYIL